MMKSRLYLLLLLLPLIASTGDSPLMPRMSRVALAVNDQASFGTAAAGSALGSAITRSTPVVLDNTNQMADYGMVSIMWTELRANKELSEKLYAASRDYGFRRVLTEKLKSVFTGTPATVVDAPEVGAAITRASINHPVKFVSNEMGPLDRPGLAKSRYYSEWERAVVEGIRKDKSADTLLVSNVLLWGIKMGGRKCEEQTGDEAINRVLLSADLSSIFNSACASAVVSINNRVIKVSDGSVLAEFNESYSIEAGSTEQYLADSGAGFKHDISCVIDWYGENLKRRLTGLEQLKTYKCAQPTPI